MIVSILIPLALIFLLLVGFLIMHMRNEIKNSDFQIGKSDTFSHNHYYRKPKLR